MENSNDQITCTEGSTRVRGPAPGYTWSCYGGLRVIIQSASGYANASYLCKQAGPRRFVQWGRDPAARRLITAISADVGAPLSKLLFIVREPQAVHGTYVHPDLLPHIASWASPAFALKAARAINAALLCGGDSDDGRGDMRGAAAHPTAAVDKRLEALIDHTAAIRTQNESLRAELARVQETVATMTAVIEGRAAANAPPPMEIIEIWSKPCMSRELRTMHVLRCPTTEIAREQAVLMAAGYTELIASVGPMTHAEALWRRMREALYKESLGAQARVRQVGGNGFILDTLVADHFTTVDVRDMLHALAAAAH